MILVVISAIILGMIIGMVSTVAFTVYIGNMALKKLNESAPVKSIAAPPLSGTVKDFLKRVQAITNEQLDLMGIIE